MTIQTVNYYVSQHKDDEAANVYRVIEVFQTWVNAFPKEDSRAPILFNLTRDEAETSSRMFNRESGGDGFAAYAKARIEFLGANDTNTNTAERPDLTCPLIY